MPWLQLSITTNQDRAPLVENLLLTLGALSVTYQNAEEIPVLEPAPWETRLWQSNIITGLFSSCIDIDLLRTTLQTSLPPDLLATLKYQSLEDQIWERVWLQDFTPMCFGEKLWVCPSDQYPDLDTAKTKGAVILHLDPGLAFGTGTHPTTALCLSWLATTNVQDWQLLDYGCGSGILAIAAARLGAASVTAIDYDAQALEATKDNARKNNLTEHITIATAEDCIAASYDCVIANILAETLQALAPKLISLVRPGGFLVLSGILAEQATEVAAIYQKDIAWKPMQQNQEWILLVGIRRHI
ncbi:hypothetical protein TI03_04600 [Achromatium sp. WMS1]|nr:hypothetical protein TI03_04600 [Achromatium sp. WMS1]